MMEMIDKAYDFAREKHKNQRRKVSGLPYILHIYDVCQILLNNGASPDALIVGALHDTVEDTDTTLDEIYAEFGSEIAYMVDILTEKKSMPYEHRKNLQAIKVRNAPLDVKMVKCADLLANMRCLKSEVDEFGDDLWKRFNAPKMTIAKHHKEMLNSISELGGVAMYEELTQVFSEVFGSINFEENKTPDESILANGVKTRSIFPK